LKWKSGDQILICIILFSPGTSLPMDLQEVKWIVAMKRNQN
jgi:hypothetical protein